MRSERVRHTEQGVAVVDFALVSVLVMVVVSALLQLTFALHARNVLTDAAGEGARRAALAGGTPEEARDRVEDLCAAALRPGYVESVDVRHSQVDGLQIIEVEVTAPLPLLGTLGPSSGIRVKGRAVDELALTGQGREP